MAAEKEMPKSVLVYTFNKKILKKLHCLVYIGTPWSTVRVNVAVIPERFKLLRLGIFVEVFLTNST
jgi:hypothetical protein